MLKGWVFEQWRVVGGDQALVGLLKTIGNKFGREIKWELYVTQTYLTAGLDQLGLVFAVGQHEPNCRHCWCTWA
ncbi:hypothetical protein D3C71_1896290 [compost metagenome]